MTKNWETSSSSGQQGMTAGGGVDRISNLPDSILHNILTFLDTKSAVQTSLLSKQWESTWKHVHALSLELDFDEYLRYEMFVDEVLSLRHPFHVSKVSYVTNAWPEYPVGFEFSLLRRIVQYAVSHGAQHFDLRHNDDSKPNIPLHELFDSNSDTVRSLKLVWFDLDCRPVCSGFQLLTKLELNCCRFLTDGEHFEPFSQFRCLNDLFLEDCSWVSEGGGDDRSVILTVSGLELVNLSLLDIDVSKLKIFAPKLKSFYFVGNMEISELTLPSLVYADIQLTYVIFEEDLVFMFHGLRNVEYLTLCDDISWAVSEISSILEQQPPFTKLKKLNLKYMYKDQIPYKVLDNYFFGPYADLNIQIRFNGFWQVMIERLA